MSSDDGTVGSRTEESMSVSPVTDCDVTAAGSESLATPCVVAPLAD
jgi:hypothetical protein